MEGRREGERERRERVDSRCTSDQTVLNNALHDAEVQSTDEVVRSTDLWLRREDAPSLQD